jgi:hypothetical protein
VRNDCAPSGARPPTSSRFVGLAPPEHENPRELYEGFRVEKLRKRAPARTHSGDLADGEHGARGRLMVRLPSRNGVENAVASEPQPISLIATDTIRSGFLQNRS